LVNDLVEMNERTLASSTVDGVINIWDIYTYPVKSTARLSWKPHSSPAVLARLTESQLFTASLDAFDAIQLWDIQNGTRISSSKKKFLIYFMIRK